MDTGIMQIQGDGRTYTARSAAEKFSEDYWAGETPKVTDLHETDPENNEKMAYFVSFKHKKSAYRVACIDTPTLPAIWRISR